MRLRSIKLAGFKSFVDPTKVELLSNRVAIVGPNGCGKSNIIDAVRWVMGESSAKQLRGESLVDVIFNGSTHRPPISQASIELHFDNSDGTLGGAYASYHDIVVRRQVTRDGQSNYSLNGSRCRRKDITDIFLGTGLGPRSYAIIEQGTISRLIEAKPDELRIFLEEAAGISKYKERRKETENRLSHTRDNLARLNDIRDELSKQIAHLDRQAIAATRFKQLKSEERLVKAQLLGLRSRLLKHELLAKQQQIEQEQDRLTGLQTEVTSLEASNTERLNQQEIAQTELNAVQQQYMEQGAAIARLEQSIHHANQRYQQIHEDLRVLQEQITATEALQARDHTRLQALTLEITLLEPQLTEQSLNLDLLSDQLTQAEHQNHSVQATWDQLNQQLVTASQLAQQKQHELQKLEHQHQQLLQQQERVTTEQSQLTLTLNELQTQLVDESLIVLEEQQQHAQEALDTNQDAIESARQHVSQTRDSVNQWHQRVSSQQAEITALETFQAASLKRSSELSSTTLQSLGIDNTQTLIKTLEVEPGFEKAVEAILGPWLQALCVTELAQKLPALSHYAKQPLRLINCQNIAALEPLPFTDGISLLSKVKGPAAIVNLLSHVYWVEQFTDNRVIDPGITLINADGMILKAGLLQMGKNPEEGVLERQRQLHLKHEQLAIATEQLTDYQAQFTHAELALTDLEQARTHYQQQWQQFNQQWHQQQSVLHIRNAKLQQCQERLQSLNDQSQQTAQAAEALLHTHDSLRDAWQVALSDLERLNLQRADALQQRDYQREQWQHVRQQWQTVQQQVHQFNLQHQKQVSEKTALEHQLTRLEQQLTQLSDRNTSLTASKLEVLEPIPLLKQQVEHLLEQRFTQEQQLTHAKITVQRLAEHFRHNELLRRDMEQKVDIQRAHLETVRLSAETLSGRLQSIQEQLHEAELTSEILEAELPHDCSESGLQQQLDELAQKIHRLGLVNLAAIEEFTVQNARKTYLDSQHEDLIEAMGILENAIRTIDRETKTRFSETFDHVNQNFQKLFPQVFAGGKAYLELTGDDLLSTGVVVFAQPPGKRNSTIHLLSGGEKALTAVALVFAIFQINPAPFCMLDEVDAPLDDTNVARFCHLVNLMADKTQFIMVTHNKVAMEMADQLMGVTMQEPGVSRLVSVDIQAALAIVGT